MNTIYLVDGKPHRICDCPKLEGKCPRGVERSLQTTQLSQCFVPAPDVLIAGSAVPEALQNHDIERAFQVLETYGVPRARAKTVANGIDVLATRYHRDEHFQSLMERDAARWRKFNEVAKKHFNRDQGCMEFYLPRSGGGFKGFEESVDDYLDPLASVHSPLAEKRDG